MLLPSRPAHTSNHCLFIIGKHPHEPPCNPLRPSAKQIAMTGACLSMHCHLIYAGRWQTHNSVRQYSLSNHHLQS